MQFYSSFKPWRLTSQEFSLLILASETWRTLVWDFSRLFRNLKHLQIHCHGPIIPNLPDIPIKDRYSQWDRHSVVAKGATKRVKICSKNIRYHATNDRFYLMPRHAESSHSHILWPVEDSWQNSPLEFTHVFFWLNLLYMNSPFFIGLSIYTNPKPTKQHQKSLKFLFTGIGPLHYRCNWCV